ncbi:MAG: VLRF1 family aeRF1-type release factor, partial [Candidatus Acidiferrales bacterium]
VYLSTNPAKSSGRDSTEPCLTWLNSTGKVMLEELPASEQGLFLLQLVRVEEFLRERRPNEKGLAIFAGPRIWEIVPLQLDVQNELRWGKPALAQLLWLGDEYPPYGVFVIDRAGARLFRYWQGQVAELMEKKFSVDISQWKKKELGHIAPMGVQKARGSPADVLRRRMNAQYQRLCRETARQVEKIYKKEGLEAIFLVGSLRLTEPILAELSHELQKLALLVDEDSGRLSASQLRRRMELHITNWKLKHASAQVASLLRSNRGAVTEFDETLARLQKGEIKSVLAVRGLNCRLHSCDSCGLTDRSADPICPACGGKRHATMLRDVLPELARKYRTQLQGVEGEGGERLREQGGMGGWVRQVRQVASG